MLKQFSNKFGLGLLAVLMLVMVIGCSSENPMSSIPSSSGDSNDSSIQLTSNGGNVEIFGRIASVDTSTRNILLVGDATVIVVSETAEIVFRSNSGDIPITLVDINPGDSAEIRGDIQGDGSLLADRVRIKTEDNLNELETGGRVESINPEARTMTFVGSPMLISVALTAEIVQKNGGAEVTIELSDISPGDSVDVRGDLQGDGSLIADRVRLRNGFEDDFMADLEFTSTIVTIDYSTQQFTVASRSETILVDGNTYIFVKIDSRSDFDTSADEGDEDEDDVRLRQVIAFTDLMVGDTVEVYANQVDPNTLLAVAIELEDGAFENDMQVEIKDLLASVDPSTGTVTFLVESWIGILADGAELLGLNGEVITLADFAVGQLVEAKGFVNADGTLSIVHMHKDNSFVAGNVDTDVVIYKSSGESSVDQRRYSYNNTGSILKFDEKLSYLAFEKDEQLVTVLETATMILLPGRVEVDFDYNYLIEGSEVTVRGHEKKGQIIGEIFEVQDLRIVSTISNSTS